MSELPRCFGVLGDPIAHSRSPVMHQAAFAEMALPHRYLAFRVPPGELGSALEGARALGFGGLNLTVPLKQAALEHLDGLDEGARRIGAVNTVVLGPDGMVGHNTDGRGFIRALELLDPAPPTRAVILGAGGASLAVVDSLRHTFPSMEIAWASRRPVEDPRGCTPIDYDGVAPALEGADLLVNTTTVGMSGGPADFPVPIPVEAMAATSRVVDLVYPRPAGGLLDRAAAQGHRVQDGLPMLLWQGVFALELWLDRTLPEAAVTAMDRALRG